MCSPAPSCGHRQPGCGRKLTCDRSSGASFRKPRKHVCLNPLVADCSVIDGHRFQEDAHARTVDPAANAVTKPTFGHVNSSHGTRDVPLHETPDRAWQRALATHDVPPHMLILPGQRRVRYRRLPPTATGSATPPAKICPRRERADLDRICGLDRDGRCSTSLRAGPWLHGPRAGGLRGTVRMRGRGKTRALAKLVEK
jgi:hypothetical protein